LQGKAPFPDHRCQSCRGSNREIGEPRKEKPWPRARERYRRRCSSRLGQSERNARRNSPPTSTRKQLAWLISLLIPMYSRVFSQVIKLSKSYRNPPSRCLHRRLCRVFTRFEIKPRKANCRKLSRSL